MNTHFKLLVVAIIAASSCVDSTANAEDEDGFVSIFDGNTLDGWHVMNGAPFAAEDGVIKLNGALCAVGCARRRSIQILS